MEINLKKTNEDAYIPEYAHIGDSGFDFRVMSDILIHSGERVLIPTGIAFEIPLGYELQVRPKSGISFKTGLRVCNSPGTIDAGFRDQVSIIVENTGDTGLVFNKGDKIAQGVICPVIRASFVIVENLTETVRGDGGFGSTGA